MIRKIVPKIKEILRKALLGGITPKNLAYSAAVGVYISFSPFPGAHTILMLALKWLLGLHLPTLFIFTTINNPWTMIPFFSLDYVFGYWLTHKIIGWEPSLTISLSKLFNAGQWLMHKIFGWEAVVSNNQQIPFFGDGIICLWSFMIGGNILGIISGLITYPIMLFVFERMHAHIEASGGSVHFSSKNTHHDRD